MPINKLAAIFIAASISLLGGCGGGGGGGTPAVVTPQVVIDPNMTVPFQTAMANLVNNGVNKSYTLSGWIDQSTASNPIPHTPISGSGTSTVGSPTGGTFTSGPLKGVATLKTVAVMAGAESSTGTYYYSTSNYTLLAEQFGSTSIFFSPYNYPMTVKAGDTGALGNGSDGLALPTTITSVYSVASDSTNSLLITVTDTLQPFANGSTVRQTVYRVTTSGNITLLSETETSSGLGAVYKVLTFTFT